MHQTHPVIHTDWKSNKNKLTDELRNQIVKECCEDLISPAELASRHGVNVVQIRKIVKDAGKKLPTKYKVTSSRNIRYANVIDLSMNSNYHRNHIMYVNYFGKSHLFFFLTAQLFSVQRH